MKVMILGASGYLGGMIYEKMKRDSNMEVSGTCGTSRTNKEFIRLDVTYENDVKEVMGKVKPDVVVWSLMNSTGGNKSEKYLTELGLRNILKYLSPQQKIVFISTNAVFKGGNGYYNEQDEPQYRNCNDYLGEYSNAKIDGERIVREGENYIIVRPGAICGQDINGNIDKRTKEFITRLEGGEEVVRTKNLYNTFVKVEELAQGIMRLIELDYKGIIHLGPRKKESYYDFFRKVAEGLNLDTDLIKGNILAEEEMVKNDRTLDMSLDTTKANDLLGDIFSNTF